MRILGTSSLKMISSSSDDTLPKFVISLLMTFSGSSQSRLLMVTVVDACSDISFWTSKILQYKTHSGSFSDSLGICRRSLPLYFSGTLIETLSLNLKEDFLPIGSVIFCISSLVSLRSSFATIAFSPGLAFAPLICS